jgi:hypothetical protein
MIVWSGFGFLVAVVGVGCSLLTQLGLAAAMHDDKYYENNGWPKLLALLVAAAIVWPLGRVLNHGRPDRELVDAETRRARGTA